MALEALTQHTKTVYSSEQFRAKAQQKHTLTGFYNPPTAAAVCAKMNWLPWFAQK